MSTVLSVHEHELLKQRLDALADAIPPRSVWQRIEAQARAEGLLGEPAWRRRMRWLAGAGIAATVVYAALRLPGIPGVGPPAEVGAAYHTPAYSQQSGAGNARTLDALIVQSQRLENDLRSITFQPELMRASTAATISSLEDRIAAIDYQFNDPAIRISPVEAERYWRERVRLMDSLVKLRYAQAQRASF